MRKFKTVDVRIIPGSVIPVIGVKCSSRIENGDIVLLLKDGSGIREISIRDAWPVAMSKLCRKRQQAIIDTRPDNIILEASGKLSEQSLRSWKEAALAYYFQLREKRLKLSSLKNLRLPDRASLVVGQMG